MYVYNIYIYYIIYMDIEDYNDERITLMFPTTRHNALPTLQYHQRYYDIQYEVPRSA
jgi:hypothetical protein